MPADKIAPLLADIHLLTILAQTRSFTQAAYRLGVSKASVSMRIRSLERIIGVPLVHRTTRAVSLTEAGHQLVTDCAPAFDRIDTSFTAVQDLSDTPSGIVRITAPVAFGRQHLSSKITAFLRKFPDIQIQLELTDRITNLTNEGFDIAIRHTNTAPDNYVAHALCTTRSVLVASPSYLKRRGTPRDPAELSNHDCLLYLKHARADTWTFLPNDLERDANPISVQVKGPLMVNNSEILGEIVMDGLGIGLLPDFSTILQPQKNLVRVLPEWHVQGFFGSHIYILRPWSSQVPQAVTCFIDYLREVWKGDLFSTY